MFTPPAGSVKTMLETAVMARAMSMVRLPPPEEVTGTVTITFSPAAVAAAVMVKVQPLRDTVMWLSVMAWLVASEQVMVFAPSLT